VNTALASARGDAPTATPASDRSPAPEPGINPLEGESESAEAEEPAAEETEN
jgi:hypothetical protein